MPLDLQTVFQSLFKTEGHVTAQTAVATATTNGFIVEVYALIAPDQGEWIRGTPKCQLYDGASVILPVIDMQHIAGTLWRGYRGGVFPRPTSAKVIADFIDQKYVTTTESDIIGF